MLSVVITNFNYGKYLGRCVRSILAQSLPRPEYEVVVVDDASQDDSRNILDVFGEDVIRVDLPMNVGLATAANEGMKRCRGRFIVRLDSDDFVHPDFLYALRLFMDLNSDDFDAVAVDYVLVDERGVEIEKMSAARDPIACGVAFKQEILHELGMYTDGLRIGEDTDLMTRFSNGEFRLGHLPLPLYRYVAHSKSLTRRLAR